MSDNHGGAEVADLIASHLRDVQDFPQPGVLFKDIGPLLAAPKAFGATINALAELATQRGPIDAVSGVEARGFIVASALARELECALVLTRKAGKLPPPTVSRSYELEYGSATLEVPLGALDGKRVYLVDDVLATGGTLRATADLFVQAGAELIGVGVLIELEFLNGRAQLNDLDVASLLRL